MQVSCSSLTKGPRGRPVCLWGWGGGAGRSVEKKVEGSKDRGGQVRALEAARRQELRGGGEKGGWVGKVARRGSPHSPAHGCCPGGECWAVMLHPPWCPEPRGTWLPLPLAAFVLLNLGAVAGKISAVTVV